MKFNLSVLHKTSLFLLIYLLIGSYFVVTQNILNGNGATIILNLVLHFLVISGVGLATHYACAKFFGKRKLVLNAFISLLLLSMLIHYPLSLASESLPINLLTSGILALVLILYKNFLEYKNLPLVNPLVFVLLLGVFLLPIFGLPPLFISWWAADFKGYFSMMLVGVWILTWYLPWKKMPILLSFLATHLVLMLVSNDSQSVIYIFTHSTLYFMAAFILTEPKTSPANLKEQIGYGVLAALLISLGRLFGIPMSDLVAILAVNLVYATYRFWPKNNIPVEQKSANNIA